MLNKKTLVVVLVIFLVAAVATVLLLINFSKFDNTRTLPFNITVTFGRDVNTEKNFSWYTYEDTDFSYIQYIEDTGKGFDSSKCVEVKAESEKVIHKYPNNDTLNNQILEMTEKIYYRHRAYLTGLKTGTKYLYRLGTGDVFSDVYSFATPDSKEEFGFIMVADSQGFSRKDFEYYNLVLKSAKRSYPDAEFYVHLGDFVEDGQNALQWSYVLNIPADIMANNTFVPVAGNKDDKYIFEHFTLGSIYDSTAMATGWYSFDYKDIHFTVLNTSLNNVFSKKQLSWLKDDLSKNTDKRTIVITHKAPYTNANHADDNDVIDLRNQLLPVFDEYGVMAVLQGHDHFYFRSEPIYEGKVGQYSYKQEEIEDDIVDMYDVINGTVYLINSSSGSKQYNKTFRSMDDIFAVKSFNCNNPTFTYCKISNNNIIFKTYEVNVTTGNIKLIDAFGLSS